MTIPDSDASVDVAVRALRSGGLVALPTDTLYALAAVATDATAVRRLFAVKGREGAKPLPLFVADAAMAGRIAVLTDNARRLMDRFWPGALTIVVSKQDGFSSEALAGGATVALRAPDRPRTLAVIRALNAPITGTSANLSGGCDPDTAAEVQAQIGDKLDLIVDGGSCPVGIPSTIVDCTTDEPRILRRGAIDEVQILQALTLEDDRTAKCASL